MTFTMKSRAAGLTDEQVFTPDELTVHVSQGGMFTITGAAAYSRGAVLGKITASGKLTLAATAANDGSQTPYAVLAEDIDTTGGDQEAMVYTKAVLNQNKLSFGAGHTAATVFDPLRQVGIDLIKAQTYN